MNLKIRYVFENKKNGQIFQEINSIECIERRGDTPFLYWKSDDWELLKRDLFSGKKDKDGVKLYENDIVQIFHLKDGKKMKYIYFIIKFDEEYGVFYLQNILNPEGYGPTGSPLMFLIKENEMKIIGNIYEKKLFDNLKLKCL